VILFCNFSYI